MISRQRFVEFHELESCLASLAFPPEGTALMDRFSCIANAPLRAWKGPHDALVSFSGCCLAKHYEDAVEVSRLLASTQAQQSWRVSHCNVSFALCDTYPRLLVVPRSLSDQELLEVAEFRSRRRIPLMSWVDPESSVALARSSQPKVGLLRGRSHADERMLAALALCGPAPGGLVILDARPAVNAAVNKVTVSGGFEDISRYNDTLDAAWRRREARRSGSRRRPRGPPPRATIEFMDMQNINTIRASFRKVQALIGCKLKRSLHRRSPRSDAHDDDMSAGSGDSDTDGDNGFEIKWLQRFSESKWLEHLAQILKTVVRVVRTVQLEQKKCSSALLRRLGSHQPSRQPRYAVHGQVLPHHHRVPGVGGERVVVVRPSISTEDRDRRTGRGECLERHHQTAILAHFSDLPAVH